MSGTEIIPETLQNLTVPVGKLRPYQRNARRGDLNQIAESLQTHGQYKPIVVNKGTHTGRENEVLAGNHTLAAAKELGWSHLAVTYVDVTEDQATRIVLVDNRSSDKADYDDEQLLQILDTINQTDDGLDGTGYTEEDLNALADLLNDDDLEDPETPGDDGDGWETFSVKAPADLVQRLNDALDSYDGETEAHRVKQLLDAHPRHRVEQRGKSA